MIVFRSVSEAIPVQAAFKFKFERFGLNLRLASKQAVNLQNFIAEPRANLLSLNFTRSPWLDHASARPIELPHYLLIELPHDQALTRSLKQAVKVVQQEIFFLRRALIIRLDSFVVGLFHKALFA